LRRGNSFVTTFSTADHLVEHDVAGAEMSENGAAVDEVETSGRQGLIHHVKLQNVQVVGRKSHRGTGYLCRWPQPIP
jgi:hypothetical protein